MALSRLQIAFLLCSVQRLRGDGDGDVDRLRGPSSKTCTLVKLSSGCEELRLDGRAELEALQAAEDGLFVGAKREAPRRQCLYLDLSRTASSFGRAQGGQRRICSAPHPARNVASNDRTAPGRAAPRPTGQRRSAPGQRGTGPQHATGGQAVAESLAEPTPDRARARRHR